jgi:hypothetical protein
VLPATDTPPAATSAPQKGTLPLVLLALAGLFGGALLLTSPSATSRRRNR